jgi:hypothetical protein
VVVIYRDDAYAANWPMTGGMWRFADGEVVVGFTRLPADYSKPGATDHLRLDTWGELCLIRSRDDGLTFDPATLQVVLKKRDAAIAHFQDGVRHAATTPVDFTSPDTILMSQYIGEHLWAENYGQVRFWPLIMASPDRGRTFPLGPLVKKPSHMFSAWGLPSYVVRPDGSVLLFTDCVLHDHVEPRAMHTFADVIEDGGRQWNFHGLLDLERRDATLVIHPAPISLGDGTILLATRHQIGAGGGSIVFVMLFRSDDWGRNWHTVGRITDVGGTPHLLRLRDGRILLTHERRKPPFGIRARISQDTQGLQWGPEIVLRDDGHYGDLGYSRNVQRADGSILTASYFNRAGDTMHPAGPVRHIAGVIWNPDLLAQR